MSYDRDLNSDEKIIERLTQLIFLGETILTVLQMILENQREAYKISGLISFSDEKIETIPNYTPGT